MNVTMPIDPAHLGLKLMEVDVVGDLRTKLEGRSLGVGTHPVARTRDVVLSPTKSGRTAKHPDGISAWRDEGYDGVILRGNGCTLDTVWGSTVYTDSVAGLVWLDDFTLHGGVQAAVFGGVDSYKSREKRSSCVGLSNVWIHVDQVKNPATGKLLRPEQALVGYGCSWILSDIHGRCEGGRQHFLYPHDFGALELPGKVVVYGVWARNVEVIGVAGEVLKGVQRPDASTYPEGVAVGPGTQYKHAFEGGGHFRGDDIVYLVEGCWFEGYGQPWSDFGGAGVVGQGPNASWVVRDSFFLGHEVRRPDGKLVKAPAFACAATTDGVSEFFDRQGRPSWEEGKGSRPHVVADIRRSVMWMEYGGTPQGGGLPIIRYCDGERFVMEDCLVLAPYPARLQFANLGSVRIAGCNTEPLRAEARKSDRLSMLHKHIDTDPMIVSEFQTPGRKVSEGMDLAEAVS